MTLPDNDMVNPGDGPLRPEPWGLFFFIAIIIFSGYSEPAVCSMRLDLVQCCRTLRTSQSVSLLLINVKVTNST